MMSKFGLYLKDSNLGSAREEVAHLDLLRAFPHLMIDESSVATGSNLMGAHEGTLKSRDRDSVEFPPRKMSISSF